jgi:hypothetical protein
MAELYEIVIRNETEKKNTPVATDATVEGGGSVAEPVKKNNGKDGNPKNSLFSSLFASNTVKPYIQQAISFGVSQVDMNTGSSELQRKLQAFSSVGSSLGGIVSAGIVGGLPGAAAALGMQTLQTVIQTAINQVNINNQKIIESENLALARSRAGMVTNKSRGGGVV